MAAILEGMNTRKPGRQPPPKGKTVDRAVIDLENYTPAYFTFIANKLARGASQLYLDTYGVGIETWRVLVMLAIEQRVTAQRVVQVVEMDKGSVSRAFKSMHEKGLIEFSADAQDGRLRYATLTPKGRALHDRILRLALVREQAFLAALKPEEVPVLIDMLRRLHANLPVVESVSAAYMEKERAALASPVSKRAPAKGKED